MAVDEDEGEGSLLEDGFEEGLGKDHQKLALSISSVFVSIWSGLRGLMR